jgi:hypothetical protein
MNIVQISNANNAQMRGAKLRNTAIHANVLYNGGAGDITLNQRNICVICQVSLLVIRNRNRVQSVYQLSSYLKRDCTHASSSACLASSATSGRRESESKSTQHAVGTRHIEQYESLQWIFYAKLLNTSTFNETNLESSFGSIIIIFEVGTNLLIEIIMLNGSCCLLYPTKLMNYLRFMGSSGH